ncbi:MAG: N-acetyltransferase family protein [Bacteroidota bacterium]|nr:N-acetyltransferase family protein [Bacteroidota bacterium]
MMESVSFVPVHESHLEELTRLYNHYIENTTVTFHTKSLGVEEMRRMLIPCDQRFKAFVIQRDDEIAGYVFLARYKPREAYDSSAEVSIYLKPDLTGKGIGPQALGFIEKVGAKNEFHTLLATIAGENRASAHLFENAGYKQCAHLHEIGVKFDRMLDVLIFQKIIEAR